MINETFDMTFGVEFEMVLAFHEEILRKHLQDTRNHSKIVKDIHVDVRRELYQACPQYRHLDDMYMGWGLTEAGFYDSPDDEGSCLEREQLKKFGYRGYANEILTLAENLLQEWIAVHQSLSRYKGPYTSWHVTRDAGRAIDDINNWDSHGLELVTRVLKFEPASFLEIEEYLTSIRGTRESRHLPMTTKACAMHVHVGLPPLENQTIDESPPTFNLATLQHLAYILVMYEKSLRSLFPPWRREGSAHYPWDIKTNLFNFIEEPTCDDWDPEKDNFDAINATQIVEDEPSPLTKDVEHLQISPTDRSAEPQSSLNPADRDDSGYFTLSNSVCCPTVSFSDVRSLIFSPHMTTSGLAHLMNGESSGSLVSWFHLADDSTHKWTVEFKQHEGCLDAEEVKMWVTFIMGLVRLAEFNGRVYGVGERGVDDGVWRAYMGDGYRWKEWSEELGIMDLIEGMELGGESKEWVERRIRMWKDAEIGRGRGCG